MWRAPAIVGCLWAAFVLCWLVLARFNKKASTTGSRTAWRVRLVIVLAAVLVVTFRHRHTGARLAAVSRHGLPFQAGMAAQWAGVALCALGFGFAFWARAYRSQLGHADVTASGA